MSFTAEKWLIFKNVLLDLLCKDANVSVILDVKWVKTEKQECNEFQEKVGATWNKLISFMISEVKDSYLEHVSHFSWCWIFIFISEKFEWQVFMA